MVLRKSLRKGETDVFGVEEALAKMFIQLMKPEEEKLLTVSDITPEEVFGLATLFEYAKYFKSNIMLDWIKKFLLLRISRLRMGRKELILLGAGIRQLSESRGKKSIEDLFAGLR